MKMKMLSVLLTLGLLAGCGNNQPNPSLSTTNQTDPCLGYSNYGYNNPCYTNNGNGTQVAPGVFLVQVPMYATAIAVSSNSQVTAVLTPTVNAGDKISTTGLSSIYLYKYCGNGVFSFNMGANTFALQSPAVAMNGSPLSGSYTGLATAPAAGTLTVMATSFTNGYCSIGSTHWYLGSPYNYTAAGSPVAYINRCVNSSGASVTCP